MKEKISRRTFIAATGAVMLPAARYTMANNNKELTLFVGTYTSRKSKSEGIYVMKFNAETGVLSEPKLAAATEEPSFLAVSRNGKYLYSANETLKFESADSGYVSAYAIDRESGMLKFLNRQSSQGSAPCHVSITEHGDMVLVSNYLGGNVVAFRLNNDGSLAPATDNKLHVGKGPNVSRQEAPHCHSTIIDDENKLAFVNDLGIDRIVTYAIDRKSGKLTANGESYSTKPGAGPRHFKIHPNGKFAFVNNELDMTVTSLSYAGRSGKLTEIQTLSSLPEGYKRSNDSIADLHVSGDGRFLYVSNRGHDSIVSYSIDEKSGALSLLEFVKTGGRSPRNFALDPTGKFLLAANQTSGSVTVFRIDKETGRLAATGISASVPTPVCLVFSK